VAPNGTFWAFAWPDAMVVDAVVVMVSS